MLGDDTAIFGRIAPMRATDVLEAGATVRPLFGRWGPALVYLYIF